MHVTHPKSTCLPPAIPAIDVAPLFGEASAARDFADDCHHGGRRGRRFLRGESLSRRSSRGSRRALGTASLVQPAGRRDPTPMAAKIRPLAPKRIPRLVPTQRGYLTSKEGIDLGPDVVYGPSVICDGDPLREATPMPSEVALPGWREAAAQYYLGMLRISQALMRSIARSLTLQERFFDDAFERGLSTLRLLRYPPRTDMDEAAMLEPGVWVVHQERRYCVSGAPHVDSGFLTLLAQDGVPGLQARHRNGEWVDVMPMEDTLAVNFGKVLERWSAGRIKATEHRVVGTGRERLSIPFFYEARADAEIRPLPLDPPGAFEPFLYGIICGPRPHSSWNSRAWKRCANLWAPAAAVIS